MRKPIHTIRSLIKLNAVFILFGFSALSMAQDATPAKKSALKHLYFGFLFPELQNNTEHSSGTTAGFSFNLGLKKTFLIMGSTFDIGLEYINQSLSFNSYYFAPGYSVLYDKTFPFQHNLDINEFQLPILFRKNFGKEDRRKRTTYITFGWALRYFAYSTTSIQDVNTGIQVYDGKTNITFEYPFIEAHFGTLFQGAFGLQFNNIRTRKGIFLELCYKLAISRFDYTGNNSNDLLIHDSNITFNIGRKF